MVLIANVITVSSYGLYQDFLKVGMKLNIAVSVVSITAATWLLVIDQRLIASNAPQKQIQSKSTICFSPLLIEIRKIKKQAIVLIAIDQEPAPALL